MKNLGIDLSAYEQFGTGFGVESAQTVAELNKAMSVGHLLGTDPSATSAGSLKVESLEKTLVNLEFKEQDLALWQKVPKSPAYSTVEQYERLESYGNVSGFFEEGGLPEENSTSYSRQSQFVKYIGETRSVTHQAQLIRALVDIVRQEIKSGTMTVLRAADYYLCKGDADVVPVQFDGFYKQQKDYFATLDLWQDSLSVIDLRGSYLKEENVEQGNENLINNNSYGDLLMAPTAVISGFVKQFYSKKLIQPNTAQVSNAYMGQRVQGVETSFGRIDFGYDKFMRENPARFTTDNATSTKAPASPVADGSTPKAVATDTLNRFAAAYAGDYYYGVAAINQYGESAVVALGSALLTVGATQSVDLKFTAGSGTYVATGYVIYRSEKTPTTLVAATKLYPIFQVSTAQLAAGYDGGAAGLIRDRNRFISNTSKCLLIENAEEVWTVRQLAPLMKMDLARLSTADRFVVLMYITPILKAPGKMVQIINIGAYSAN